MMLIAQKLKASLGRPDEAEAPIAGASGARSVSAMRRPAFNSVAEPTAASKNSVQASSRLIHPCAPILRGILITVVIIILAPFFNIAVHIVNPERIWLLLSDGISNGIRVFVIPGHR